MADNRYAMDADWDEEMLRVGIEALQGMDLNLDLTGFDEAEIADLFTADDGDAKEDDFDSALIFHFLCRSERHGYRNIYSQAGRRVLPVRKVRITVMKKACYSDLMEQYENPIEHACDMEEGQVFVADGWQRPNGLCESAWESMSPFVMGLAHGAENFYDGWMKNPRSAMISCNDGFRPVSFLLETMDEELSS